MRLREATRRLYAQLSEMEKRHEEERQRLQVWASRDITSCLLPRLTPF